MPAGRKPAGRQVISEVGELDKADLFLFHVTGERGQVLPPIDVAVGQLGEGLAFGTGETIEVGEPARIAGVTSEQDTSQNEGLEGGPDGGRA